MNFWQAPKSICANLWLKLEAMMQQALRITTNVQVGGKIEIIDDQLPVGALVEVYIQLPIDTLTHKHSILDVLQSAPGNISFKTADDVDEYIRTERDVWEN